MQMDWDVQFRCNENLDPVFIHKLFYFLISIGIKYNAGDYNTYYLIYTEKNENDVEYKEKERKESTEKLAEIVDTYTKFNLKTDLLSIWLDYQKEVDFRFSFTLNPVGENNLFVTFGTGEHLIPDEKSFLVFINMCKEVFVRFNFSYGAFRIENVSDVPHDRGDFLKEKPNIVNFYSKSLVDKIGREKLLSTPAFKVEELENGGVMLIVCTKVIGCPDEMNRVWEHLGY